MISSRTWLAWILFSSAASFASSNGIASTLRVRVVDPSGKACGGVPLAIRSALVGGNVPAASATTNADGMAEFADAQRWFNDAARAQIPQVVADVPLGQECSLPLMQNDVPKDAVTLALPATGSLTAHITRRGDAPSGSQAVFDPGTPSEVLVEWNDPALGITRSVACSPCAGSTECVRCPWVGVGLDVRITLRFADGRRIAAGTVHGPDRAGAERAIEVGSGDSLLRISGRALDAGGKPIPNAAIVYDVQPAAGLIKHIVTRASNGVATESNEFPSAQTGADGRFHFDIARPRAEGPGAGEWIRPFEPTWNGDPWLNLAWSSTSNPLGDDALHVSIALAGRQVDGNDLSIGDVTLAPARILAQGQVRDADGNPLPGANVRVVQRLEAVEAASGVHRIEWRALEAGSVLSATNGGFMLRERVDVRSDAAAALANFSAKHSGAQCRSTLFFNFERDPLLPALVEFAGADTATDVKAQLQRGSDIHGKIVLDPSVDAQSLEVVITYRVPSLLAECLQQQNTGGRGPGPARVDKSGAMFWRMLPAGVVDVRIARRGATTALFELKGFDLPNEAAALTESLAEIDLRGKVR